MQYFEGLIKVPYTENLDRIHKAVWARLFPGDGHEERPFIFYRRQLSESEIGIFFRASESPAEECRTVDGVPFKAGDAFDIFVQWYPVTNISLDDRLANGRGKETVLPMDERALDLRRRLETNGFIVHDVELCDEEVLPVIKRGRPRYRLIGQTAVVNVTVTDKAKAEAVWLSGLGKKKSFGFGYMTRIGG